MTSPVETAIRGIVATGITGVASINRALRRSKAPNPYLTGVHKPVTAEYTEDALKVEGQIPAELNGVYLRNGPNPLKMPNHATHHWFTGDAMLHGVRLQSGKALWYRNRWIRSRTSSSSQRPIMSAPPLASVARDPSGTGWPGWYLPVSAPCAIGDQTI